MDNYRERIYRSYAKDFQDNIRPISERDQNWWYRAYSYYFRKWFPDNKQAAIVDVGCGAGGLLAVFKHKGYSNLNGVDLSVSQVELARHIVDNVVIDNSIDYLKRHKDAFSLITAIDVFEHLNKDEAFIFLDASFNALRSGGRLILQTPNAESPWMGAVYYGDMTHETCYTPMGLSRLLNMCGFVNIENQSCEPVPRSFTSIIRYFLWQIISICFRVCTFIEGHKTSGIFTRVFLISAEKPDVKK